MCSIAIDTFKLSIQRRYYEKRHDKVALLYDNVRPYVIKPVKTDLENLECEDLAQLRIHQTLPIR